MAFLVRPRDFHDQPLKGPLASCGRLGFACAVIASAERTLTEPSERELARSKDGRVGMKRSS